MGNTPFHCEELSGFKYKRDFVRNILFYIFRRVGVSVKKEAPVIFLSGLQEGRLTFRPTDVLVHWWVGGKHACIYLTRVPIGGTRTIGFTVGQATLKVVSSTVVKHEKACPDNQHAF